MLAATGFLAVAVFLAAVLSRRVSVLLALTIVPVVAAVVAGQGTRLSELITGGLETVAPVAIMITFAVLYFCLMIDSGLFDPLVRRVVRFAGGDPVRICVGTAVLTVLVALDGDGTSTFLITVTAMLPVFRRLGMRPVVLAGIVGLGAGVMNMVPWGGPTARAMAALDLTSGQVFTPLLPAMAAGIAWVLLASWLIGRSERRRLGGVQLPGVAGGAASTGARSPGDTGGTGGAGGQGLNPGGTAVGTGPVAGRVQTVPVSAPVVAGRAQRWRLVANTVLTLVLVVVLLLQLAELPVVFISAFVLALLVNRPRWSQQQELLQQHGHNVVMVTTMIFAAGVFTGVLGGTGMIEAMARALVGVVPGSAGGLLPVLVAVTSMPLSLVFTPDAYYFGVLPVLAETSAALGGDPAEIARAAVLGQMTTGFPLSPLTAATFVLIGLTGVDLGAHQRFLFRWALGTTLVMTAVALLTGALSW
ncbi:CitMHS family transporter [Kineococcus sp. SYSU DK002]|uniref:CitMHS family transporter n=1 Tax=Kineococcus sp. SYSU DK002 TaxID=3383123 RepID=UPI003D7D5BE5